MEDDQTSPEGERGFAAVLANRHFVRLWMAQALSQTAQNGIHFVQMVLIERLTGSSTHMGLMILAFSLPGVLFSAIAGVVVDRLPKKWILVGSNLLRVFTVSSYLWLLAALDGWGLLLAVYAITFVSSSIGQFFSPAEGATIPLLVGKEGLLAANALFNLTLTIAQIAGLMVLAPLGVKLAGERGAFAAIAFLYLMAALLVTNLPKDTAPARRASAQSAYKKAWEDLREGWHFIASHPGVYLPLGQLTLISTLIMIMAMLAPGFAARVLGMNPEDAIFIFAPAGLGMLLATFAAGRFGHLVRRETVANTGLGGMALGFAALGWVSRGHLREMQPLFAMYPEVTITVTTAFMGLAFLLGFVMALVNIVALTALQERSPSEIRGRVYAVLFLMANLMAIPPLLTMGGLADLIGIPRVSYLLAGVVVVAWGVNIALSQRWLRGVRIGEGAAEAQPSSDRPKILILMASAGGGHRSVALALQSALQELYGGWFCVEVVDGLKELPFPFPHFGTLYNWLVNWFGGRLWSWVWYGLGAHQGRGRLLFRVAWALLQRRWTHMLERERPDLIVVDYPLFTEATARAVRQLGWDVPVVTVVTDLVTLTPFWLCPLVDRCFVPTESAREQALAAGIPPEKVEVVGMPISLKFARPQPPKLRLRKELGLRCDLPVVLVVGGGEGMGNLYEVARAIGEANLHLQLVVITGKNWRLRERLKGRRWDVPTVICGFVHDMHRWMAASDVIVTKAGPSTIAEALALGLPVLLYGAIPGQEEGNVTYVVASGVGTYARDTGSLVSILKEWLRPGNPTMEEMAQRACQVGRADAVLTIARELANLLEEAQARQGSGNLREEKPPEGPLDAAGAAKEPETTEARR
ncbi:MAG: MFS transporter [Anaerolineae bacterium]